MYLKFHLKSFYKIKTPAFHSSNLILIFFFLNQKVFNSSFYTPDKIVKTSSLSFFILPVAKKSIIFLRAPYKNKLARLNIVRLRYSAIISIKINHFIVLNDLVLLHKLVFFYNNINLSSFNVKHVKTSLVYKIRMPTNFIFSNYI